MWVTQSPAVTVEGESFPTEFVNRAATDVLIHYPVFTSNIPAWPLVLTWSVAKKTLNKAAWFRASLLLSLSSVAAGVKCLAPRHRVNNCYGGRQQSGRKCEKKASGLCRVGCFYMFYERWRLFEPKTTLPAVSHTCSETVTAACDLLTCSSTIYIQQRKTFYHLKLNPNLMILWQPHPSLETHTQFDTMPGYRSRSEGLSLNLQKYTSNILKNRWIRRPRHNIPM